ncbi:MFS transporter [Microbacterium sp. gxy059]|uniref:MFS transporter n=1 Tax=Microbacterium sp. gxy059 TaxID=2957199 RepID=UPI003D97D28E
MTTTEPVPVRENSRPARMPYGALLAMMGMSFLLVTAEFLPGGMLTPIADSLGVTPGQAGQMVTVTALVGLVVAPTVGLVFPRLDRRALLVWLAVAAAASNLVVAIAPTLPIVLVARLLLGAALSAFWAMSITVAARIAGPERLGRAVMFTTTGNSLATVLGVPVGVVLSEALDWRAVFAIAGAATIALAVALRALLPSVPAAKASSLRVLVDTLRRPGIGAGLAGHALVVLGHFLAYTYVRLALERIPGAGTEAIVLLLALFGVGGLIGNIVVGLVVDRRFALLAAATPVGIAAAVAVVILAPGSVGAVGAASFVWGFLFASWMIVINTWAGNRAPDRLEAVGGLVVVGFQAAIALAAGLGGLVVDALGVEAAFAGGAVLLVAGSALFALSGRR